MGTVQQESQRYRAPVNMDLRNSLSQATLAKLPPIGVYLAKSAGWNPQLITAYTGKIGRANQSRLHLELASMPWPHQIQTKPAVSFNISTAKARDIAFVRTITAERQVLGKRRREEDEDPDDVPSSDDDRKRRRATCEVDDPENKLFACPYAKYNPARYSERNEVEASYRGCSSKLLRNIARVKQHLYRIHTRPAWYCPRCGSRVRPPRLAGGAYPRDNNL